MRLNYTNNVDYEDDIENNDSINYGPLSICKVHRIIGPVYQVDCSRFIIYSKLFQEVGEAIDKFKELVQALKEKGHVRFD